MTALSTFCKIFQVKLLGFLLISEQQGQFELFAQNSQTVVKTVI